MSETRGMTNRSGDDEPFPSLKREPSDEDEDDPCEHCPYFFECYPEDDSE